MNMRIAKTTADVLSANVCRVERIPTDNDSDYGDVVEVSTTDALFYFLEGVTVLVA